ncbi:TadE family protein [Bifidobacterium callimiconis]|uniref:TadE family protein n=1 Tax=Bifidobacterium callimiconis TaxID=2306973 RepID=UPI0030B9D9D6
MAHALKRHDQGTVTAEFAVVLPTVMVVALLLLSSARAVTVSMNCQEAARVAAREMVIAPDGDANPSDVVTRIAGSRATVRVEEKQDQITVTTRCPVGPGPLGMLPVAVEGEAVGLRYE